MKKLCIPEKILDQHLVVLGKTGAGKSSALRHIVEHLLREEKRVCIVDPKGDWWGLKTGADGKKSGGFPVIAFGDFKNAAATDVPINAQSGRHVAELIASGNRPAIIGFRGWMTSRMVEFWIDFASGVFNANEGELYLVGDEFHNFAPKGRIMDPQAGRCLHWSNRLMSEGRGLGIVCLIASQRPQKVHNDTLTSCETLVAMRVVHAADRGAVEDWIEGCGDKAQGREVLNSLASMPRGEAFVWSPEAGFGPQRVSFPMFESFDSFAPPQLQPKVSAAGWADVDLDAVKEKLSQVIEEAKANDPRELKKQIAELRAENIRVHKLAAASVEKGHTEIKRVEVPVIKDEQIARLEKLASQFSEFLTRSETHGNALGARAFEVMMPIKEALSKLQPKRHSYGAESLTNSTGGSRSQIANLRPLGNAPRKIESTDSAPPGPKAGASFSPDLGALNTYGQSILDALAKFEALGKREVGRRHVAALAGKSPRSSVFDSTLAKLRAAGLLDYGANGGTLLLTAAGRGKASPDARATPATSDELIAAYKRSVLSPYEASLFGAIVDAYPGELSRDELSQRTGKSAGSSVFDAALASMRGLGIIDYRAGKHVVASEGLFS